MSQDYGPLDFGERKRRLFRCAFVMKSYTSYFPRHYPFFLAHGITDCCHNLPPRGKYCDYAPSVKIRIWFAWPVIPRNVRHSNPFLSSYQCIRNWSRSSGGTSRIIRECSSGDTVAKPAITMALLALERRVRRAARGWNTRNMGRAFLSAPKPRWRSGQSGSLAFWNEGRNQWMNDAGKAPSGAMNFYASRSTPVVGEVRPVNRAVRYLIRAR